MAYTKRTNEERKELIDNALKNVEKMVPEFFHSDKFQEYLRVMSKFHSYSVNNQILIYSQKPDATYVAGFKAWQDLNRHVNKGEKGIMVLAPYTYKYKKEVEKLDENGNVVRDKNGKAQMETKELTGSSFRSVYVFDISQTSGKELPEPIKILSGNSKEARDLLETIESYSSFPITYADKNKDATLASGAKGYYSRLTNSIVVDKDLPMDQKAKTLIHELAHGILHNEETNKSREQKEIEAEAVAYTVSNYFGLDTSSYSFGYIAAWSEGKNSKELSEVLKNISKSTNELISSLEESYLAIKEKNKDLEVPEEQQESPAAEPEVPDTSEPEQTVPDDTMETATDEVQEGPNNIPEEKGSDEEPSEETPEEPQEDTSNPSETSDSATDEKSTKNKIEDFGEKIGGAKKDLWRSRGLALSDLDYMNDAERNQLIKKDNIWPKPDYKALVEEGLPVEVAYYYKVVRDATPTTFFVPRRAADEEAIKEEQEKYISFVSGIKDAVMACKTMHDIKALHSYLEDNEYVVGSRYSMYPTDKAKYYITNKLFKALSFPYNREREFLAEINRKQFCFSKERKILSNYYFLPVIKEKMSPTDDNKGFSIRSGYSSFYFYPKEEFADLSKYQDGTFFVANHLRDVIGINFASQKEAEKYVLDLEEGKEQPEKQTKHRKTALKPEMLEGIERIGGDDYRNGSDVSGQDYLDTFNFKGGEFGNWLNDKDRQASLNCAFDAFKDFARALNIDDKDVTLNGKLSIAFGARGSGNALAHYEPARTVINITKMKGAGSLGHELIHFIDDCVGKQLGFNGYMSEKSFSKEVPESFKKLIATMQKKELTPEQTQKYNEKVLDEKLTAFKNSLSRISRPGPTPEKEAKRQELIQAIADEVKSTRDYQSRSFVNTARGKPKLVTDKTPSPAFKAFMEFQNKEINDKNPARNIEWCNQQREFISRLAQKVENPTPEDLKVTAPTKFYSDAQFIDKNYSTQNNGYWASTVEMLARAGHAYLKDKLKEQGIRNDYLCGHADQAVPMGNGQIAYISPHGEERKAINKAFDAFFEELKEMNILHEPEQETPSLDSKLKDAEQRAASQSINTDGEKSKDDLSI